MNKSQETPPSYNPHSAPSLQSARPGDRAEDSKLKNGRRVSAETWAGQERRKERAQSGAPPVDAPAAKTDNPVKVHIKNLNLWYGEKQALFDISMDIVEREVTAFIGPSGCGKSSFLRCLNRMNDLVGTVRIEAASKSTVRTSTTPRWTWFRCARASAWCFRTPTRSPRASLRTLPMRRVSTAWSKGVRPWTI